MVKDPENPMGRELPVKDFVKQKLEEEKEKKVLDEIVAKNNVTVAEDFAIPQVSDEQMQEMMKKQMQQQMPQMPPASETDPAADEKKPEPKKSEPKKK
jgi:hypothetical protein